MGQILIEAEIVWKVGFGPTRLLGHILPSFVQAVPTGSRLYSVLVQNREAGFRAVPSCSTPVAVKVADALGAIEHRLHSVGHLPLRTRHCVSVHIHRRADVRMPQHLAYKSPRYVLAQGQTRRDVPEIMERERRGKLCGASQRFEVPT